MNSLFLSPVPLNNCKITDGVRIRAKGMLSALERAGQVSMLAFHDDSGAGGDVPLPTKPEKWERLLSPTPSLIRCFRSDEFAKEVNERSRACDLCFCCGLQMMQYASHLPNKIPVVLDNFNVESDILERLADRRTGAKRLYWRLQASKLRRFERWAIQRADRIIAISDADRKRFTDLYPGCAAVTVPPGLELDFYFNYPKTTPIPTRMVFVAALNWHVNIDAALWMSNEVFPKILAEFPDATLDLVGKSPASSVMALDEKPGISVYPNVPDVLSYLARASVVVVPLRYGSGVQTKVIEAMAIGRPVVTTSVGAEGLKVTTGHELLVADDSDSFARVCLDLLSNEGSRRTFSLSAREAARHYTRDRLFSDMQSLITGIIREPIHA